MRESRKLFCALSAQFDCGFPILKLIERCIHIVTLFKYEERYHKTNGVKKRLYTILINFLSNMYQSIQEIIPLVCLLFVEMAITDFDSFSCSQLIARIAFSFHKNLISGTMFSLYAFFHSWCDKF